MYVSRVRVIVVMDIKLQLPYYASSQADPCGRLCSAMFPRPECTSLQLLGHTPLGGDVEITRILSCRLRQTHEDILQFLELRSTKTCNWICLLSALRVSDGDTSWSLTPSYSSIKGNVVVASLVVASSDIVESFWMSVKGRM